MATTVTSRINSTGTTRLPNYLRNSTSSCHDSCKVDDKPPKLYSSFRTPIQHGKKAAILLQEEGTKKVRQGNKVSTLSGRMIPPPARKQTTELKWKSSGSSSTCSRNSSIKSSVVKSYNSVRTSRVEAIKDVQTSRNSQPRSSSPRLTVKTAASIKSRTSKSIPEKVSSQLGIKNGVGKPPSRGRLCNCSERTVINENNSNENQRLDSKGERMVRGVRSGRVAAGEDGSSRKLRFRKPKVSETQTRSAGSVGRILRKVVSSSDTKQLPRSRTIRADLRHGREVVQTNRNYVLMNNMIEETASKLVRERMSKVKALVGAFENVIKFCDSE